MTPTDELRELQADQTAPVNRALALLERNPVLTIAITVGLLTFLVAGISLRFAMKTSLPLPAAHALIGMAERSYAVGDYDECIALLEEFHTRNRQTPTTETMLANAHFRSGALEKAKHHYSRVLEMDPTAGVALMNLALTYRHLGELDKARECYAKVHDMYAGRNETAAQRAAFCIDLLENEKYASNE